MDLCFIVISHTSVKKIVPQKSQILDFWHIAWSVFWCLAVVFGIGLVGVFFPFFFTSIKIHVDFLSL